MNLSKERITIKCDKCGKEWESSLSNQKKGFEIYGKNLCRGCKQKEQYKRGLREEQKIKAGEGYSKKYKGKKLEEIVGKEKAKEMKKKFSENNKGENNWNFGGKWHGIHSSEYQRGKTYDEIYGKEKSKIIKNKVRCPGNKNGMFGKPSPQGSGNGWSGWYKGWFFRSLKELSFMINVIERFGFNWENGEQKKYKISYTDREGNNRNYFSDFILNEKYMIEIKPKKLHNSDLVKRKKNAAIKFCEKRNLKYKLLAPIKTLSYNDIKILLDTGEIKFIDRYKEKFELWQEES